MVGDLDTPRELLGVAPAVAAILAALVVVVKALRWLVPLVRKVGHLVDDLTGSPERPGVPARPGVMARLERMEHRTEELVTNSGSSIKDVVHRLDRRTAELNARVSIVERHITPDEEERRGDH